MFGLEHFGKWSATIVYGEFPHAHSVLFDANLRSPMPFLSEGEIVLLVFFFIKKN